MKEFNFKYLEDLCESNDADFLEVVRGYNNDFLKSENISSKEVYGEREGYDCDEYVQVTKFTKDGVDVFAKISGYYASHCGTEYDGCIPIEVTPIQKVVTDYINTNK